MIHIEIEEISNGFVLTLFDSDGPSKHDKTVYVEKWGAVLDIMEIWYREVLDLRKKE